MRLNTEFKLQYTTVETINVAEPGYQVISRFRETIKQEVT